MNFFRSLFRERKEEEIKDDQRVATRTSRKRRVLKSARQGERRSFSGKRIFGRHEKKFPLIRSKFTLPRLPALALKSAFSLVLAPKRNKWRQLSLVIKKRKKEKAKQPPPSPSSRILPLLLSLPLFSLFADLGVWGSELFNQGIPSVFSALITLAFVAKSFRWCLGWGPRAVWWPLMTSGLWSGRTLDGGLTTLGLRCTAASVHGLSTMKTLQELFFFKQENLKPGSKMRQRNHGCVGEEDGGKAITHISFRMFINVVQSRKR